MCTCENMLSEMLLTLLLTIGQEEEDGATPVLIY